MKQTNRKKDIGKISDQQRLLDSSALAPFFGRRTFYKDNIPVIFLFSQPSRTDGMVYYDFPEGELRIVVSDMRRVMHLLLGKKNTEDEDMEPKSLLKRLLKDLFSFIIRSFRDQGKKQLFHPEQIVAFNDLTFVCRMEGRLIHFELLLPSSKPYPSIDCTLDFSFRFVSDNPDEKE